MLWLLINSLNYCRTFARQKRLLFTNQRPYTMTHKLFGLKEKSMAQAKTLTDRELRKVLSYISLRKHATRNRAMLLVTHWSGMRVGEVAALRISDILSADGAIKDEVRLLAEQTKGKHARSVFLPEKLRKELNAYLATIDRSDTTKPLLTQKRDSFTANTLCQHFHWLYKQAGIDGASSHSGRRSFITALASKGVGVRVLMALAGQCNISTTQAYIDINDENAAARSSWFRVSRNVNLFDVAFPCLGKQPLFGLLPSTDLFEPLTKF